MECCESLAPIYIAGRRHSGSTFLDVILGSSNAIESFGEIVTGLNIGENEKLASGELMESSEFWNKCRMEYSRTYNRDLLEDGRFLYKFSSIKYFFQAYCSSITKNRLWNEYAVKNCNLMNILAKVSGKKRVLDSNKEYTRALLLLKSCKQAQVLHLLRDPNSIAASHYYRVKVKGMPIGFMKRHFQPGPCLLPVLMITVGLSWTIGLIAIALMKMKFKDRILDVSYENLCNAPEYELKRIGQFLNVDLHEPIMSVVQQTPIPVGYNIGGNELRHNGSFVFVPNAEGRRQMPSHYRLFIGLLAAPGFLVKRLFVRFD